MDWILHYDYQLFDYINQSLSNNFLDWILPIMRDKYTWVPVYFFFMLFAFYNFSWQKAILLIIFTFVVFGIADVVSSQLIKETIMRPRPCHINSPVDARLLVHCGTGYSFTSSHATNHMAISIFLAYTMFRKSKVMTYVLIAWALLVSFSQVYVGVHYPVDVLTGITVGGLIGLFGVWTFGKLESFLPEKQGNQT